MSDLDQRYADWRATPDGERVVRYVRQRALDMRLRGWRHYGIAALVEVARYDAALEVGPDKASGTKVNNSYRAFIARELMQDERLDGFFEVRRSVADVQQAVEGTYPVAPSPTVVLSTDAGDHEVAAEWPQHPVVGANRDPRWSVEAVPVASRWRCVQPGCGKVVTREEFPDLQPGLGGYLSGRCPDRDCWSNNGPKRQGRGATSFAPITKGAHL